MRLCQVHVASGLIGPRSIGRMSGLPARHTFRTQLVRSISDSRKQKLCLTDQPTDFTGERLQPSLAHFGIVSLATYRQALTGLSWLSFSRSQIYCDTRMRSASDSVCHQTRGSPRRPTLNEVALGDSRTPWEDLVACERPHLLHIERLGLQLLQTESVRIARFPTRAYYRVERRD
jgi:hypothetical protein